MSPEQAGIACPGPAGGGRAEGISKEMRWLAFRWMGILEENRQDIYKVKSKFRRRNELLTAMEKLSRRHSSLMCADKR